MAQSCLASEIKVTLIQGPCNYHSCNNGRLPTSSIFRQAEELCPLLSEEPASGPSGSCC